MRYVLYLQFIMGQITNILIHFQCIQVLQKHVSSCKKKHMHLVRALQKMDFQITKYIERSTIINYKIL